MSDIKAWFPKEAEELERLRAENLDLRQKLSGHLMAASVLTDNIEGLKAELAILHHKDELRTKEHNLLVQENRKLSAKLKRAEAEIAKAREDETDRGIERDLIT